MRLRTLDHEPYGLSTRALRSGRSGVGVLVALAIASGCCASLLTAHSAQASSQAQRSLLSLEERTVGQINEIRVAHGLHPVAFSDSLFEAANAHCEQMLTGGYFGHQTPTGASLEGRLATYYPPRRYGSYAVGENLFWTQTTATSSEIVNGWMASPSHRANLLNPSWREVGLAVMSVSDASGVYAGAGATIVTADFGVRS